MKVSERRQRPLLPIPALHRKVTQGVMNSLLLQHYTGKPAKEGYRAFDFESYALACKALKDKMIQGEQFKCSEMQSRKTGNDNWELN
jgi:hypothetical protein